MFKRILSRLTGAGDSYKVPDTPQKPPNESREQEDVFEPDYTTDKYFDYLKGKKTDGTLVSEVGDDNSADNQETYNYTPLILGGTYDVKLKKGTKGYGLTLIVISHPDQTMTFADRDGGDFEVTAQADDIEELNYKPQ